MMESPKDRIRRLREQKRSRNRLDLLVPGYEGELGVRYEPIDPDKSKEFGKRLTKSESGVEAANELIAEASECLLVRGEDGLEPLKDDEGTVTFAEGAGEYLGFEAESVRDAIRETFSPDGTSPFAAMAHANALMEWMQGNDAAVDRALLGE